MKWVPLLAALCLAGCNAIGGSTSTPPPQLQPSITSVTVTPSTANVVSGQTKQFSASVTGTGNFNQAVTWTVTGDGTITSAGLFTAGGTTGTATVIAVSVEDPTVSNNASVSVGAIANGLGEWAGTITSADGTQVMPLDFQLDETVAAAGITISTGAYGPLVLMPQATSTPPPCSNLLVPTVSKNPGTNPRTGDMNSPGGFSLSGTGIGTGLNSGDVTLTLQDNVNNQSETLSLTGQFSPDGLTLSGTYTNPGFQAGCFLSGNSGTFSFSQYPLWGGTYSGTFTYGTLGAIPISMTNFTLTIGAIPGVCGSATTVNTLTTSQDGRFFFTHSDNVTQSSLAVWGLVNDTAANTITIYAALEGGTQDSPCIANPVQVGLISGITLTRQ